MAISFKATRHEFDVISKIADRAWNLPPIRRSYSRRMDLHMDISAVHASGNPLRLDEMLAADDFNFFHDVSGICNCLDRQTGKLTRGFSPRFSVRA